MWSFDSTGMLIGGLLTGIVFGFLLQRGHVTRYNVILGQFLLVNFTVLKVMLTAIIVGGVGIYAMLQMGLIEGLSIKSAALAANVTGGLIFGVGMAVLGYCPGTGIAAIGEGSRHAIAGALGMLVGAAAYAEVHPLIQHSLLAWADQGKVTLATISGVSPWVWLLGLLVLAVVLFALIERWERRRVAT